MKRFWSQILLLLVIAMLFISGCSKVPAGNVGIKVYLLGQAKGVDTEVLTVGRYWIGVNEELYLFPTFQQNYVWTKSPQEGSPNDESLTFQTVEGLSVNTDVGISYHLEEDKVPLIFQKYRRGIDEITHVFMRNTVRDAFNAIASQYTIEAAYGKGKSDLLLQVQKYVNAALSPQGIIVDKLYWVGDMRLPEAVIKALNNKIAAIQAAEQTENELRQAEAEAKKKIATARGEAEANRVRLSSMTSQMIEYERMLNDRASISNQKAAIDKWDGKLSDYLSLGSGAAMPVPLMNMRPRGKQQEE